MRNIRTLALVLLLGTTAGFAQNSNPLVGSWERIKADPPALPAFLIFSNDGFFTMTILPADRPKSDKPLRELTKDELIVRYERLVARRGPYRIEGNRLIRNDAAHHNPNLVGRDVIDLWRIEGDTLILSDPKGKDNGWYRRAK
jgi:hypothetical protein